MSKSFLSLGIIAVVLFSNFGCAPKELLYYSAPSLLPASERSMKTAGFWISRHPSPDKIILKPDEITELNRGIQDELKLTQDIVLLGASYSGEKLKSELKETLENFLKRHLYPDQETQFNFNLENIPLEIKTRYGLIVHYANQRLLPTERGLYAQPFDIDFDEVQNSSLDVGTPVVVLHQSKDGQWLYTVSNESAGWIHVQNVGLCSLEQLKIFSNPQSFLVVTKSKADIFLNQNLTEFYDYARMGTRVPINLSFPNALVPTLASLGRNPDRIVGIGNPRQKHSGTSPDEDVNVPPTTNGSPRYEGTKTFGGDNRVAVIIPLRKDDGRVQLKTGYLQSRDIHEGFLPYTARNTIEQAFELLNAPYGWGGMYGEQDCSAFLQEVFKTVGIYLPRNSQAQAKVGKSLGQFEKDFASKKKKIEILSKEALGGATILPLKGHSMLFLGTIDDRAYAIHATWGYREKAFLKDRVRVVNRVVVSDLSLGEGSHKGSLLERLRGVRIIGK